MEEATRLRKGCKHPEVAVTGNTIYCTACNTSATLPYYPANKKHKHDRQLFAGNGKVYWYCTDRDCGWEEDFNYDKAAKLSKD